MELIIPPSRLDRPVDHETDHVLGRADAEITLVEYGSYACPHCRAANEPIAQARDQLGDRVCYAFRHRLQSAGMQVIVNRRASDDSTYRYDSGGR
ncbi:thioredoxin domain-containing protein [Bradyrhizobium neotropicale]|uniref:thioredoxin domain-containing protein n=1 Tax=Bradyrhizobium neotropicale TaxID=1497615 RepID=UPI00390806E4